MATRADVAELYERHIKLLPPEDRLRLLEVIARDLAHGADGRAPGERSLLELEGLGSAIWEKVDAQEYVNQLRQEWDHRS